MIYIERTITINNNEATIEEPIVLYKGDMNIELQFIISNNPFKYKSGTSITYGQLVIKRSEAKPIFSEPAKLSSGKVLFTITGDMIDDLEELGNYDFQIRMINSDQTSRGTLPPVSAGIIIKEPICEEAAANITYVNKRNAYVMPGNDNIATFSLRDNNTLFDEDGNYIKTEWTGGDIITDTRLNRVEDALYQINDSVPVDYIDTENAVRMINDNNSYIEDYMDDLYTKKSDMYIYATEEHMVEYINDLQYVDQERALDMINSNNSYILGCMDDKYTTEAYVDNAINNLDYVTQDRAIDMINSNNNYILGYVDDSYATQDYVDNVIENIDGVVGPQGPMGPQGPEGPQGPAGKDGKDADLTGYATEEYVNNVLGDIEDLLGGI